MLISLRQYTSLISGDSNKKKCNQNYNQQCGGTSCLSGLWKTHAEKTGDADLLLSALKVGVEEK